MNSADFYDHFIQKQIDSGINDRLYGLYKRTCELGLRSGSKVLEIGCGIGALTYLLAKKVKSGKIEAVDISPLSVDYIKKNLVASNLFVFAGDILKTDPPSSSFDFVLLFDVIEHIPLKDHPALFKRISNWMHDQSLLLINIPNPGYILYDEKNNPAALQELDQPVYAGQLANALNNAELDLVSFETYGIWVRDDYQFIVARKRKDFEEKFLSKEKNILQKAKGWIGRKWRKLIYKYPPGT